MTNKNLSHLCKDIFKYFLLLSEKVSEIRKNSARWREKQSFIWTLVTLLLYYVACNGNTSIKDSRRQPKVERIDFVKRMRRYYTSRMRTRMKRRSLNQNAFFCSTSSTFFSCIFAGTCIWQEKKTRSVFWRRQITSPFFSHKK